MTGRGASDRDGEESEEREETGRGVNVNNTTPRESSDAAAAQFALPP